VSRENVEVVRQLLALGPEDVLSGSDLSDLLDPELERLPPAESLIVRRTRCAKVGSSASRRSTIATTPLRR
jgi:hypothetical protein